VKYFIESTSTGYRFGWEGKAMTAAFEENGGNGPIEGFYAETEKFFHELRKNDPLHTVREPQG